MRQRFVIRYGSCVILLLLGALLGAVLHRNATAVSAKPKGVVHVVFFKLKSDAPKDAADTLINEAHRLLSKVPVVRDVKAGRRAPGDRPIHIRDYDVGLYVYFDRLEDIQTYLDHPLHLEYAEKAGKLVETVRVADFYSE